MMNETYLNDGRYVVLPAGVRVPDARRVREEGRNYGTDRDGRAWWKDVFAEPGELTGPAGAVTLSARSKRERAAQLGLDKGI